MKLELTYNFLPMKIANNSNEKKPINDVIIKNHNDNPAATVRALIL